MLSRASIYPGYGNTFGAQVDGLLGVDFFRNQVVALDFDEGYLRFLDSAVTPDEASGRADSLAI